MNRTDVQTLLTGAADEPSRRIVARLAIADIDNTFALLAAVYKLAIKDAWLGDTDAAEFLNITAPNWQQLSTHHQTERAGRARRRATQKSAV